MAKASPAPADPIRLVVGLGNPGDAYENTRHNAGAWWVLAEAGPGADWRAHRDLKATLCQLPGGARLLRPTTYMNESGRSLQAVMHFYKIAPEAVLVVHDELDFAPGVARLKFGGGHGGHNGLRDIMQQVGPGFWRLRLGIGHPGHRDRVHGYVLQKPQVDELASITRAIEASRAILPHCLSGEFQGAMRQLHEEV